MQTSPTPVCLSSPLPREAGCSWPPRCWALLETKHYRVSQAPGDWSFSWSLFKLYCGEKKIINCIVERVGGSSPNSSQIFLWVAAAT